uniref:Si:ch211-166a6.5 n=1 Tax=Sinocyclocheilus rhinocerous TaxID=307959 RepID=A0A673MDD5_9TELE
MQMFSNISVNRTSKDAKHMSSFNVKIGSSSLIMFSLQVHGFWLVQDAIMTVLGREEVAPRMSIALALSGVTLDPMMELQDVKGFKAGVTLRLVEEPYSPRSAQAHLARVQDMLKAVRPQDALMEGRSPAVLNTLTQTSGKKYTLVHLPPPPPACILPGASEIPPLTTLLPTNTHSEAPSFLLDLSLSCWNPPPGFRKLQGDFMYISVHTLEGKHCDITSCPRGFYVNRSTLEVFDPRPAQSTPVCHCLTDLLSHISPQFKHNLSTLRHRPSLPAEETLSTPYRTVSWLGISSLHSHKPSFSGRLGLDQDLSAQAPDWNKELQTARDLPQRSLEERLQRDRALLQVNSAFVWAVAQAAEKAIDGFVDSISGSHGDPAFLCGGVFMSMPAHRDQLLGGERSHRAAQRLELRCVQAYSDLDGDLQNLHTIPTALADYRGVRLSAQGLAPGIQGPEQAEVPSGLLYGYSAGPLENPSRRKLLELVAQSAKALSLQRHAVLGLTGHQLPLFTSVDAQGILGADGRYYLLDVYRTMPADANFLVEDGEEGAETEGSFPRRYPHVLCRLRPELVKAFIQHKKACKDVGSVSDIIFEMRFNPNGVCAVTFFCHSHRESILISVFVNVPQLRLREYILDTRNKAPISPDDVLNILPVVKHITMTTTDATRMFTAAQNSLQKGLLEQAYEQLKEATYLFGRVCDDLHPEACHCLSLLAKVAYVQGHPAEARSVQLRVVVISERVLGFDHPNTIQQYVLLAVYLLAGGETALAQRCLYRAKVLLLAVHGADHPYTAVIDASLGLVLQGEQALQYLQSALKLNSSFRGDADLTTALMHHLLAQRLCVAGDYRGGMNHEKERVYVVQQYGEDHPQTKCSSDFLRNITQQAVRVERSIRQGGAELCDTPPEVSTDTTLEQLALVNGILKTSYR